MSGHDFRRQNLPKITPVDHGLQQIIFGDDADQSPVLFHDREAPEIAVGHHVGNRQSIGARGASGHRILHQLFDGQ